MGRDRSRPVVCHLANCPRAAAILNKECKLRTATVSIINPPAIQDSILYTQRSFLHHYTYHNPR